MKHTIKLATPIICLLVLMPICGLIASASEKETSQFDLFVTERNLPFGEADVKNDIEPLNNVIIDEVQVSLKEAFGVLGSDFVYLLTDGSGLPRLKPEDAAMLRLTGPYYTFGKTKVTDNLDIDEFRLSFDFEPVLAYIIHFDGQPIGVLNVTYSGGNYDYVYASDYVVAKAMEDEVNSLSTDSQQPAEDIVFINIGAVRFAFNCEDVVKSTLPWTPENASFYDLMKAYYVSETEMKALIADNNGINDFGGGGNVSNYLYNADTYIERYRANEVLSDESALHNKFLVIGLSSFVVILIILCRSFWKRKGVKFFE